MKTTLFFFLMLSLGCWGLYAQSGVTLDVHITKFESNEGQVYVALYDAERNWLETRHKGEIGHVADGEARVKFGDVPPGTYAISLFHDTNGNGELDTNFLGIPKEPIACSNNAVGRFGPPKWSDAKFEVGEENLDLNISFE